MRFAACWDIAWAAFTAWLGGRHPHEAGDCRVVRWSAGVRDVGAADFEHKGAAPTSDGLVSVGLRVVFCVAISAAQEESMGPVEANVV